MLFLLCDISVSVFSVVKLWTWKGAQSALISFTWVHCPLVDENRKTLSKYSTKMCWYINERVYKANNYYNCNHTTHGKCLLSWNACINEHVLLMCFVYLYEWLKNTAKCEWEQLYELNICIEHLDNKGVSNTEHHDACPLVQ